MKTKTDLLDSRTLEDIVFEFRNKAYGAYELNRKHRKYLLIAFLICITGVSTAIAVPFIHALKGTHGMLARNDGIIVDILPPDEIIQPPVLPTAPPPDLENQATYTPPIVVEDAPPDVELAAVEQVLATTHNPNVEILDPVPPDVNPPIPDDNTEPPVFNPQEPAMFMGGTIDDFRIWVQQHIVYPEIAKENNISGKVFIQFCINARGEMVNATVVRKVHESLDNESLRVITLSTGWKAARQGGHPVKQQFTIPVVFVLQNN